MRNLKGHRLTQNEISYANLPLIMRPTCSQPAKEAALLYHRLRLIRSNGPRSHAKELPFLWGQLLSILSRPTILACLCLSLTRPSLHQRTLASDPLKNLDSVTVSGSLSEGLGLACFGVPSRPGSLQEEDRQEYP